MPLRSAASRNVPVICICLFECNPIVAGVPEITFDASLRRDEGEIDPGGGVVDTNDILLLPLQLLTVYLIVLEYSQNSATR